MIYYGFVKGNPIPQGSMRAFKTKGTGKMVMVHTKGKALLKWRKDIADVVRGDIMPHSEINGQYVVYMSFTLPKGKSVRRNRPCTKPDLDKLVRAVLDALTGVAFKDDSQVVEIHAMKYYESKEIEPGVLIEVRKLG